MFRSATDALRVLEELKKRRVSLVLLDMGGDVTGDGITKLVFTILSAVAAFERERIQERIREAKAAQREQNKFLGHSDTRLALTGNSETNRKNRRPSG